MARIAIKNLPPELESQLDGGEVYENDLVKIIHEEDWHGGGKYSSKSVVFGYKGQYYEWSMSRSGSYFTEYDVTVDPYVEEVEPVQKTITVFERKVVK